MKDLRLRARDQSVLAIWVPQTQLLHRPALQGVVCGAHQGHSDCGMLLQDRTLALSGCGL